MNTPSKEESTIFLNERVKYLYSDEEHALRRNYVNGAVDMFRFMTSQQKQDKDTNKTIVDTNKNGRSKDIMFKQIEKHINRWLVHCEDYVPFDFVGLKRLVDKYK